MKFLRYVFRWAVAFVLMIFTFPLLAMMAMAAVFIIVPAIPFLAVAFWDGVWLGHREPDHARIYVVDVTQGAPALRSVTMIA